MTDAAIIQALQKNTLLEQDIECPLIVIPIEFWKNQKIGK